MRLMIFGAGFSGLAIAREMRGRVAWTGGTTRSRARFPALEQVGLTPFTFDGETLSESLRRELGTVTHLIQSIAPDGAGDPLLRLVARDLRQLMPELVWTGYLSTVGVYGDHGGRWVDEQTRCRPVSRRSIWRDAAEKSWLRLASEADLPVAILRLSGIYGPGRNALVKLQSGQARRIVKPGQFFNRIHVDDIAGACVHLGALGASGIWNVSDDLPAPPQDVVLFAAQLMGIEPPAEVPFEEAELSPMGRSFYGEVKRVSNDKLKHSGYTFRYPDYRSALTSMWRDGSWRG